MLTKTQIVDELVAKGAGDKRHVNNMLKALEEVAVEQIAKGEDFALPGVARVEYVYRAPKRKGERWTKGQTVSTMRGEEIKDSDSPPVAERCVLKAKPIGTVAKLRPGTKPEAQKEFFKTRAAKAVRARKRK
jgi:nucleoid DNA-binding protein